MQGLQQNAVYVDIPAMIKASTKVAGVVGGGSRGSRVVGVNSLGLLGVLRIIKASRKASRGSTEKSVARSSSLLFTSCYKLYICFKRLFVCRNPRGVTPKNKTPHGLTGIVKRSRYGTFFWLCFFSSHCVVSKSRILPGCLVCVYVQDEQETGL